MAGKIINNSQPPFREEKYMVDCKKFKGKATIMAHYAGSQWTKTDAQKAYRLSGWKCSLIEESNSPMRSPCMDCPFKPDMYL